MRILLSIVIASAFLLAGGAEVRGQNVDNVVILLDASGSMNDLMTGNVRKINAAKTALKEVLKTIPQTTQVGLLVFSASNVKNWAYPMGPRDDKKLEAAIDLPIPSSSTPLGTYMKIAGDRLLQARKEQFGYGSYRLLIVTDGEANSEPASLVSLYTRDIIQRGIVVDVIGVKMSSAHTLATKVHSYRSAADPASLKKAITEVFAEVSKQKDDKIEDDAFSIIEPIPGEISTAIIAALSSSGNQPIGEAPPVAAPAPVSAPAAPAVSPDTSAPAATPAPPPSTSTPPATGKTDKFFSPGWIIAAIVVIFVLRSGLKRK